MVRIIYYYKYYRVPQMPSSDPEIHPQHCEDVMKDNIGPKTVAKFYEASETYGLPSLRHVCYTWFLKNLMTSTGEFLAGGCHD
jgi:hypothetical protein